MTRQKSAIGGQRRISAMLATLWLIAPASDATHGQQLEQSWGLQLVGTSDLGGGRHGDIWVHESFAYLGTASCGDGVRVVDVRDSAGPQLVATVISDQRSRYEDVVVNRVRTSFFEGNLLAVGLQLCETGASLGADFWDVTDPKTPRWLGFFNTSPRGVHELHMIQRGDRVFALLAVPGSESAGGGGDFRIVEVTDPANPIQVADWGVVRELGLDLSTGSIFCHSAWADPDTNIAFLSYWDAGVILLDIADPTRPRYLGRTMYGPGDEGNAHSVWTAQKGKVLIVCDEDFSPGGAEVRITGPPSLAGGVNASEATFTKLLCQEGPVEGELVYIGPGCSADPLPVSPRGKIALIELGVCNSTEQVRRAQSEGTIAALLIRASQSGDPSDLSIPAAFIALDAGAGLRDALARGEPVRVRMASDRSVPWGLARIYDIADPANPRLLGVFATESGSVCSRPPQSWLTVHNPFVVGDNAYFSWYSDGVRMVDISDPAQAREVGYWSLPERSSVWGLFVEGEFVYLSDISLGLQILRRTEKSTLRFALPDRGALSARTPGKSTATQTGYARLQSNAGSGPIAGLALFGLRKDGVLVTEAAVSASRPVLAGRIYTEIRGEVNTGLALANPNDQAATISFYFTDEDGRRFGEGSMTLDSNGQIARFLDQAPFNGTAPLTGTFSFMSSLPIGVTALRGRFNERSEFLITTIPIAELEPARPARGTLLPQFAEGGGWATEVILINHSDSPMSGSIEFFDPGSPNASAQPIILTINGLTASRFDYQISPRSARRFATSGEGAATRSGSVRIMPSAGLPPTAVAIFAFRRDGIVVSEAGVAAVEPAQAFHLHAEIASALTGIAVANAASTPASIEFELTQVDGSRLGPESRIVIPGNGQVAVFLNQIEDFDTITLPFTGVLRVSTDSAAGIAVTGLRGITNERGDFLVTSTPALDDSSSETNAELLFSHFADGGGYTTRFVLLAGSAGRVSSGVVRFVGSDGRPASLEALPPRNGVRPIQ